jgi:hypothetical protein
MGTRTESGVVLISALLLVVLVGLIGRAIVVLGPSAMSLSNNSHLRVLAQEAADSGLNYATSMLRANPEWKGNSNRVVVDTEGLFVIEDEGNVIGLITGPRGQVSQFRLRFNYQDGNPGAEGLDNPGLVNQIDIPFVSVNNLELLSEVPVPRADSSTWSVSKPDEGPYTLPSGAACLLVEGRAGPGLRDHTKAEPNASPRGRLETHVAEAYVQVAANQRGGEASIMGGGDIVFKVPDGGKVEVKSRSKSDGSVPRLRSKGSLQVLANGMPGPIQIEEGELSRDSASAPGFVGVIDGSAKLVQEQVGDGKDFFNLSWDDVQTADSDPNTTEAVHIPGGTYVHWDDGTTHYYDMGLEAYKAYMAVSANQTDPGVKLSPDFNEIRDRSNLTANPDGFRVRGKYSSYSGRWTTQWEIEKDLYIAASPGGVAEFSVLPRSGAAFSPSDTGDLIPLTVGDDYDTDRIEFEIEGATLSSSADVHLLSKLKGKNATLTSEGSLRLITGNAELKSDKDEDKDEDKDGGLGLGLKPKLQLNLYVQEDITISTYDGKRFEKVELDGLVYSWGNFKALLGDPLAEGWGKFELNGALVAYGADPASGEPGSNGSGKVEISADRVKIEWDDRKMAGVLELGSSAVTLKRTLYGSLR